MSNKSEQFKVNPDILEKAQEALKNPQGPEAQQALEQSKSFIERNQKVIIGGIVVIVALKVNKRKVAKATAKAVAKELKKSTGAKGLPSMMDILHDLRETPGMAYIPHGGGMVHLLKGNDTIITVFGDFDRMDTEQIWNRVANVLNITRS